MPRRTLFLLSLALLSPAVAFAQAGIDRQFSRMDGIGVGDNTGVAVGGSPPGFDVELRDLNNQPVIGAIVDLDFSATSVRAYATQAAGTTVNAAARKLDRVTDSSGNVSFAARTGGFENSSAVRVYANGVLLGSAKWRSTDIDGQGGATSLSDFSCFSDRFLSGAVAPECNFDLLTSDVPGLGDLLIFAAEYFSGAPGAYAW